MNLDLPKASGPDCIPVVVVNNREPELSYILAEPFNKCLKESCFPDCWKVSSVVPVFKNVGERSTAKNYHPVSLLSVVSKVFEKLLNNRIVDHLEKCGFFLISSMVLGLLDQLQIFSQLYLTQLLRVLTGLGLLELWQLICPRLFTGFGMLVFFTNVSLMELQVRYLTLCFLFSVIDGLEWFWMEHLYKNIQLMLEFHKAPLIRHLICGNNLNWLLNLNLIYQTLWTGVSSDLLISMLRQLSWFRLTSLITMVLLM